MLFSSHDLEKWISGMYVDKVHAYTLYTVTVVVATYKTGSQILLWILHVGNVYSKHQHIPNSA